MPLSHSFCVKMSINCVEQSAQLDQWATYLVGNTLYPADQLATTDFSGYIFDSYKLTCIDVLGLTRSLPNQTNLAVKGRLQWLSYIAVLVKHVLQA